MLYRDVILEQQLNFNTCNTPEELIKWMDCIDYGWLDSKGNIQGTGDNDSTDYFYDEYRLQSPSKLINTKVGVCWDQVELERSWFMKHKIPHAVVYVEAQIGEDCPTHTYLIYKDKDSVCWFEHSWGPMKGIKRYKTLQECLIDSTSKVLKSFGTSNRDKKIITKLNNPIPAGTTCEAYYNAGRSGNKINVNSINDKSFFK